MRVPVTQVFLLAFGALASVLTGCGDPLRTTVPGAINTGTFPNLNIAPKSAAAPITDTEKSAMFGQIGAAQGSQAVAGSSSPPPSDPALLKKIATEHGDETLKAIEAK